MIINRRPEGATHSENEFHLLLGMKVIIGICVSIPFGISRSFSINLSESEGVLYSGALPLVEVIWPFRLKNKKISF
jgi:hypothetical protein